MQITASDVADLAAGATLLGSGGGGDTATAAIFVCRALNERGPVELVSAADLDPDAWVVPVAATGSITVMLERLPSEEEFAAAVRGIEHHLGIKAAAVHAIEAGGVNALIPVAVASWLGLPLVDADGMGRAFPRFEQTVLTTAGINAAPAVLTDAAGNEVLISAVNNARIEHLARTMLPALGGWAATAMYAMQAADSVRSAIPATISGALRVGRQLRRAQAAHGTAERIRLLAPFGAALLFAGPVQEVQQRGRGVRTHGSVTIEHDRESLRALRVEMADEYLLALDDGRLVGCVPDLICLLDSRSWQPISTERVSVGHHVDVLRLPSPQRWQDRDARQLVGPAAFGLDFLGR